MLQRRASLDNSKPISFLTQNTFFRAGLEALRTVDREAEDDNIDEISKNSPCSKVVNNKFRRLDFSLSQIYRLPPGKNYLFFK